MKAEKANQELSVEMYFVGIRLPVLTCTYLTRLISSFSCGCCPSITAVYVKGHEV